METSLFIDGKPTPGSSVIDILDPSTGKPFAQSPVAEIPLLDAAVTSARRAFPAWSQLAFKERSDLLLQIADKLDAHKEDFAALLSREQGKPRHSGAAGEIAGSIGWIKGTAALDLSPEELIREPDKSVKLYHKPLGVVGSITPWNFPVMIAVWHVIPALLAGNTVVIKPSSNTPLTTLNFVALCNSILPPGVINSILGDGDLGRAMSSHPGIDKIVFTGSTPTGRDIMARASANLKRLTLELGGNDAAIVLPDVDVQKAAKKIFAKSFGNCGQICAAIKRLYVHTGIHDALASELVSLAKAARIGPGHDPATQFGPLQNEKQRDYVAQLVDDARANGGTVLAGGQIPEREGFYYPLTVVTEVSNGVRIVDEEQFGPVLPIIRVGSAEEAVVLANDNENGLGGSVWSSDLDCAESLALKLECGSAWVNDHSTISPDVPFGGAKQSGIGTEFGRRGLEEFTQLQAVRVSAL